MKRLIISGIACPKSKWQNLFTNCDQEEAFDVYDVFSKTKSNDIRELAKICAEKIFDFQPESLICHDLGVPMTLIALMRLKKKNQLPDCKLTIFNGALRNFNVFKATHPIRIQFKTRNQIIKEIHNSGGEIGSDFDIVLPRFRKFYRKAILFSFLELFTRLFGQMKPLKIDLGIPIQMIQSANDPYIPQAALRQIEIDFDIQKIHKINYGHFPYSGNMNEINSYLSSFEQNEEGL